MAFARYYTRQDERWRDYAIELNSPERATEGDPFCRVTVNGQARDVHGIDEVQAIVLAVVYLQGLLRELDDRGTALYLSPDLDQRVEIGPSFLGDFTKYL